VESAKQSERRLHSEAWWWVDNSDSEVDSLQTSVAAAVMAAVPVDVKHQTDLWIIVAMGRPSLFLHTGQALEGEQG